MWSAPSSVRFQDRRNARAAQGIRFAASQVRTTLLASGRRLEAEGVDDSDTVEVLSMTEVFRVGRGADEDLYTRCPIVFSFASLSLHATSWGRRFDKAASAAVTPAASPMPTAFPVTR